MIIETLKRFFSSRRIKNFIFLFRWFLINRYYCDCSEGYKSVWWVIHKVLWSVILLSVIDTILRILEYECN